jgi:signal transduction histidine kinase
MENTLAAEMKRLEGANAQSLGYVQWPSSAVGESETYWQACDSQGNVMGRTDNLDEHHLPLSPDGLDRVQAGTPTYEVTRINAVPLLVYSQPVVSEGETIGILQVARSIAEQEQALGVLQASLAGGGVITLLLALGGGWLMAGASLRPIDHLTRTAQMVGKERDFKRRVEYHGPQDEVGRLAMTFNDMLAALDNAYQQVAQALQSQRWFVADASHELRTPLTSMRGNLALLQREPPISAEDRQAVLADVVDENERMIRLVNDLMTLARADDGPALAIEPVQLTPLFAELERQSTALAPACVFEVNHAAELAVDARRDLLKQTLLILLDNAFRYTPSDGQVTLTAAQEGSDVLISVRDTGVGIAPDKLPHIFKRFYRADPSRHGDGHGLGLAIAQALIEQVGGTIEAHSTLGEGSRFTIRLRRSSEPASTVISTAHGPAALQPARAVDRA